MKISELADQVRSIPLRDVLEHYGFETKPEGTTLRARSEHHNIVVTGSRWFDNKAGLGGGGAIDLVIHIAQVNFFAACRSLAERFRPFETGQKALSVPKSSQHPPHPEKKSFEELAAIYAVRVIVALDNDRAGEQGWRRARDASAEWIGFQISSHSPKHKDWNEDLIQLALRSLRPKQAASLKL
jgi:hypothetical protein